MVFRVLIAASLAAAACAPAGSRAFGDDVPIVIGELGDEMESAVRPPAVAVGDDVVPPAAVVAVDEAYGEAVMGIPEVPALRSACAPDARSSFTVIDALFMARTNAVGPLAVENQASGDPGEPVITAGDVRYPAAPGMRLFQGWRGPDSSGWELGYLGIWGMHADALAVSAPPGSLAVPGQLGQVVGSGFDAATAIAPALNASLNGMELNVFSTRVYPGGRHDPLPWRRSWRWLEGTTSTCDWLLGIRWAGLDEAANLAVTAQVGGSPPAFNTTGYRVTTSSQLVGPQIGHRRRVEWHEWALEGWVKAGLMGSFVSQSQGAVVGPFDLVQIREPRSSSTTGVGMIGDLNATIVRRFGDHWGVRAGYTLIWLTGVAPAASQWDFSNTPTSGTGLVTGTVFLHGATLGLEARW